MPDSLTVWAFGNDGSEGRITVSTDGGRSWALKYDHLGDLLFGGAVLSPRVILATGTWRAPNSGDSALILRSSDGGASWQRWTSLQCPQLGRIQRLDSLTAFTAFFPNQVLLRTTDAGISWHPLPVPQYATAFLFSDWSRGMLRWAYQFWLTHDAGQHWQVIADLQDSTGRPPVDDFRVDFMTFPEDTLSGWAFGSAIYLGAITEGIYHTTDGGYRWQMEAEGLTGWELEDACMVDNRHGWAVSGDGRILAYRPVPDTAPPGGTAKETHPGTFQLEPNYPNPFNGWTVLRFRLPERSFVKLEVVDLFGRSMAVLVSGFQEAGTHDVRLDAASWASGLYLARLTTARGVSLTRKLLLVR